MEVEGVTVKAAAHVDPAALQAAAHVVDVMLDGREDIAECMAEAGAGMLIIPKGDPLTSLPEYRHWKGKVYPKLGQSVDEVIRGSGGHPQPGHPDNAATDETHLIRVPITPAVTVHEYAHSIQNFCFTPEDDAKWNAYYAAAKQANAYPGAYAMLDHYEFWAVLSTVYLDASNELGDPAEVRAGLERDFRAVWNFLKTIYGVITATPDSDTRYIRYRSVNGDLFPWRTYVGGTYVDDALGYSVDVPPGWNDIPERKAHPDFAMFFVGPQSGYLDISARPLPNRDSLKSFAEGVRDGWLERDPWMLGIDSFEQRREEGRESWFMTFRRQTPSKSCPVEDGVALIALSSQYDDKPYVFTLVGGVCRNSSAQDMRRQDLLDMFASFR